MKTPKKKSSTTYYYSIYTYVDGDFWRPSNTQYLTLSLARKYIKRKPGCCRIVKVTSVITEEVVK